MCNCTKNRIVRSGGGGRGPTGVRGGGGIAPPEEPTYPAIGIPTVDTAIWGAPLWTVLHTLAEFTHAHGLYGAWVETLRSLVGNLPCPECAFHYEQWCRKNGLPKPRRPADLHVAIRTWIGRLHNDVNKRRGSPAGAWDYPQLTAAYGGDRTERFAVVREMLGRLQGTLGAPAWDRLSALVGQIEAT
jgi:hypothetical protein